MKIKTKDLVGTALDWVVTTSRGLKIEYDGIAHWVVSDKFAKQLGAHFDATGKQCGYSPSTDWACGGPIIEREKIELIPERVKVGCWCAALWDEDRCADISATGPTPLIAAMRCYVAFAIGDEVEVPNELVTP
ncbi:phage protein NinX family protein [Castellaniella sp.]|uniref:phage protein NinX family protein n=1 Tax=Castellaniella sp. TaxID=1955812 RepID=UPI002B0013AC|nr:phage protein NinX family protein [Castellaniella sp.]